MSDVFSSICDGDDGSEQVVVTGEGPVSVFVIKSNGACLFLAVAHQLQPSNDWDDLSTRAAILRTQSTDFIKKNLSKFRDVLLSNISDMPGRYPQKTEKGRLGAYIRHLEKETEWGGHECIIALNHILQREIHVLQEVRSEPSDASTLKFSLEGTSADNPIKIVYRLSNDPEERQKPNVKRNHYDSFLSERIEMSREFSGTKTGTQVSSPVLFSSPTKLRTTLNLVDYDDFSSSSSSVTWPNNTNKNIDVPLGNETDEEMIEHYAPGQWDKLTTNQKESEKRRWICHEKIVSAGLTVVPFQPQTFGPSAGSLVSDDISLFSEESGIKEHPRKPKTKRQIYESDSSCKENSPPLRNIIVASDSESINQEDDAEIDPHDNATSVGSNQQNEGSEKNKEPRKKRGRGRKIKRKPGQEITATNCLPTWSPLSLKSIEAGFPLMRHIIPDIRAHVDGLINHETTGGFPEPHEYDLMCQKIVEKWPCLGDFEDNTKYTQLKHSVRKSLASRKYYKHTAGPALKEIRVNVKLVEANKGKPINTLAIANQISGPDEKDVDASLKLPESIQDLNNGKQLVARSYSYRQMLFEDIVMEMEKTKNRDGNELVKLWMMYPHYKITELLFYEYSLRIQISQDELFMNFDTNMERFRSRLSPSSLDTEVHDIMVLVDMMSQITPPNYLTQDNWPAIQIKDEDEIRAGNLLNYKDTNKQPPSVLVVMRLNDCGDFEPLKSYLLAHGAVLNQIANPTGLDCAMQLLAVYFIFGLSYPNSYKSYLRVLERIVHGGICIRTLKQRPHQTYKKFFHMLGIDLW
ncbi:Deubiquitinase OTUD6B [Frankliniella fusca]|uniref:Deubiquitinase OTUD6B n=1 Tax=Frankliniella fusca TaxID=407009 RepID=A0AAE1HIY2_9NEOP|nr:Deubiquitinase OTUD6B [Frankliniella fusca]KAK3926774.1 Deubiquitinase OTUD6B [Frankliniella fusca]